MKTTILNLMAAMLVAASTQAHAQGTLVYDQQSAASPVSPVGNGNVDEDTPQLAVAANDAHFDLRQVIRIRRGHGFGDFLRHHGRVFRMHEIPHKRLGGHRLAAFQLGGSTIVKSRNWGVEAACFHCFMVTP